MFPNLPWVFRSCTSLLCATLHSYVSGVLKSGFLADIVKLKRDFTTVP